MPRIVMNNEPSTWIATAPVAHINRPCCSSATTSAENAENVVNPPRNPVITKSRHSGASEACVLKKFNATPTKKPPRRFAINVPGGIVGNKALSCRQRNQRNNAPHEAPAQIAKIEYAIGILFRH